MESAIYVVLALCLLAVIYASLKTVLVARRVGFVYFARAVGTLVGAFSLAGWKLVTGANNRTRGTEDTEYRTTDPFLSPLEKSPEARSPLVESPIDNPEGYYIDDQRSG